MHKNNSKILKKFLYFKGRIRFHVDVFLKKQQQKKKKQEKKKPEGEWSCHLFYN